VDIKAALEAPAGSEQDDDEDEDGDDADEE
jgi:hypothetical protein